MGSSAQSQRLGVVASNELPVRREVKNVNTGRDPDGRFAWVFLLEARRRQQRPSARDQDDDASRHAPGSWRGDEWLSLGLSRRGGKTVNVRERSELRDLVHRRWRTCWHARVN